MNRMEIKWHDIDPEEAIATAEAESGIGLDAVQRRAVSLALRSRAVVITGGPGVGKTYPRGAARSGTSD